MRQQRRFVGRRVGDEVALRARCSPPRAVAASSSRGLSPAAYRCRRSRWMESRCCAFAPSARRCEAVNVQRRLVQQLNQRLAACRRCDPARIPGAALSSLRGASAMACFSSGAERRDAVVEVRDQHMAGLVLHAGEQLRQHHGRIGRPVSVMPAMQFAVRTVHGYARGGSHRARRRPRFAVRSDRPGRRR